MYTTEQIVKEVNRIILDKYGNQEYILLQILYDDMSFRRSSRRVMYPGKKEFYAIVKENFETVKYQEKYCVHANYKPTKRERLPELWLRQIMKAHPEQCKDIEHLYILCLTEAEKIGAKTTNRTYLKHKLVQYEIKI